LLLYSSINFTHTIYGEPPRHACQLMIATKEEEEEEEEE
jgi:hypothetical protein